MLAENKKVIDSWVPSDRSIINNNVEALEQFVLWAEAFLQQHYTFGSEVKDAEKIREEVEKLRLDIQCVNDFVNNEF